MGKNEQFKILCYFIRMNQTYKNYLDQILSDSNN